MGRGDEIEWQGGEDTHEYCEVSIYTEHGKGGRVYGTAGGSRRGLLYSTLLLTTASYIPSI